MSDKLRAATHGAPTETRLRLHAPHSEDGDLLREAATVIDELRPRAIETFDALTELRSGSAVLTSDSSDTVVLRSGGRYAAGFINADGGEITPQVLWDFGAHPFTVLWEPAP